MSKNKISKVSFSKGLKFWYNAKTTSAKSVSTKKKSNSGFVDVVHCHEEIIGVFDEFS